MDEGSRDVLLGLKSVSRLTVPHVLEAVGRRAGVGPTEPAESGGAGFAGAGAGRQ
jgi:hypothetical protein